MSLSLMGKLVGEKWDEHYARWHACTLCPTGIGGRAANHVFCRGTLPCELLFVGEGPGKTEDVVGEPFVGRAGKLLDGWLSHVFRHRPTLLYAITNIVLCRPCDELGGPNRAPNPLEIETCSKRINEFIIQVARPKGLVLLGKIARDFTPDWSGLRRLELPHPSWILRQGGPGCAEDLDARERLIKFAKEMRR